MKNRLISLAMISVLIILTVTSCSILGSGKAGSARVFRYTVNNVPTTMDPSKCNGMTDNEFEHVLTEGLTRTRNGVVCPGIAESWDVSEDGTVYTFHLRDANWSDGVPITAYDFEYSWKRLLDPATKSDYAFAAWIVKGGKEINLEGAEIDTLGIEAPDEKTFRVTLTNPTAYFLSYIGCQPQFAPLRKDIVELYGDEFASAPDKNVYSGPFVLASAEDNKWVFEKNPEFWDADNIRIDRTEAYYMDDGDEQIQMFERGELDFAYVPNDRVSEFREQSNVNHFLNGTVDYCYINTECSNEALKNLNFRLALNYALNRVLANHVANDDAYKPYNALIFPGLEGMDGVTYGEVFYVDSYAYALEGDIDQARVCLGLAMDELKVKNASDISVEVTAPDTDENRRMLEELKSQWEDILGIRVELRIEDRTRVYSQIYPTGDYEIGFTGWAPDYNDPYTYLELWRSDNNSYTPYANQEIDAILDASMTEPDQKARMNMLNKVEIMLIEDAAFIPVECKDKYYMLDPRVQELSPSFSNVTIDWAYAQLAD